VTELFFLQIFRHAAACLNLQEFRTIKKPKLTRQFTTARRVFKNVVSQSINYQLKSRKLIYVDMNN